MLLIIFVFNRIVLNKNGPDGNHSDDGIETFIFNNNAEGCVDGPPNSQRFWDYISTNESDYLAGEAFYFLSETTKFSYNIRILTRMWSVSELGLLRLPRLIFPFQGEYR